MVSPSPARHCFGGRFLFSFFSFVCVVLLVFRKRQQIYVRLASLPFFHARKIGISPAMANPIRNILTIVACFAVITASFPILTNFRNSGSLGFSHPLVEM